jgi:hypothetical protein
MTPVSPATRQSRGSPSETTGRVSSVDGCHFAWAACTSLSSTWPSYRAVSAPRQTAGELGSMDSQVVRQPRNRVLHVERWLGNLPR